MHVARRLFFIVCKLLSRVKLRHLCIGLGTVLILDYFGAFTHFFEVPYTDNFNYPYEGDIHEFISALRHNEKPEVPPINQYEYSFIHDIKDKCIDPESENLRVVILVKSAIENSKRRTAIRNSWGFEKRFSDVPMRTIFLLGVHPDDEESTVAIEFESKKYQDIVQANFIDAYYNNTIKTMIGFKWVMKYCSNSKFFMFVDDDMYVSVKNILRFLRNPAFYPEYLTDAVKLRDVEHLKNRFKRSIPEEKTTINNSDSVNHLSESTHPVRVLDQRGDVKNASDYISESLPAKNFKSLTDYKSRKKRQVFDFELPDHVRLFSGYVFVSAPHRHKSSKWYVSLKEYPYHLWPPYVTAGSYILSKEALIDMYYASMYTKHFRFDDIFLGIVAKKAGIEPFHCEEFHFYKKDYTRYNYKYVISSHGYDNPEELLHVWNEQKSLGNA
ncbi:hypothetical protein QAD02_001547 [Eretmocerus hayati]|uniref:Uncharacterized protein n=1 Tax=Eretmocerus hayati TaxID=131215 RepID=A0ACC2NH99_9HYME|nr:hypothetical protein QAD02_001547 [Eretmocerus hayati]